MKGNQVINAHGKYWQPMEKVGIGHNCSNHISLVNKPQQF